MTPALRMSLLPTPFEERKSTIILNEGIIYAGNPNTSIVNESGMYSLVLSSRKPEAHAFMKWVIMALSRLDDDEKAYTVLNSTSSKGLIQNRNFCVVNESGMYSLVLSSRKPEARVFKKWITSEVIPSIRKTNLLVETHVTLAVTANNVVQG